MPRRRFWCLERQIDRIQSEQDLRTINANQATLNSESMERTVERLSLQIGETVKVEINPIVRPEPGAFSRLRELAEGK